MLHVKFKAIDQNTGKWVYGDYRLHNTSDNERESYMQPEIEERNYACARHKVIPETVCMYSGISNIYSSDILQKKNDKERYYVYFAEGCFYVSPVKGTSEKTLLIDFISKNSGVRITGNMHYPE